MGCSLGPCPQRGLPPSPAVPTALKHLSTSPEGPRRKEVHVQPAPSLALSPPSELRKNEPSLLTRVAPHMLTSGLERGTETVPAKPHNTMLTYIRGNQGSG